ncbi:MAG: signal peptide peptidase SppA, partial [Planctomycetota bacterium]
MVRIDVWFSLVLVLALAAGGRTAGAQEQAKAPPSRATSPIGYAHFEIEGYIGESLPPLYLFEIEGETLRGLLGRIERARRDDRVRGLIVRVGNFGAGWAKVQEIRRALLRCRQEGKEVVCVLSGGGSLSYYLATGADRVVLLPATHLMLVGLRAEAIFAKGLLDKIGVKAQFVQAGQYKSGGETLTRDGPSPAFREELESLLEDYYEQLLDAIAEGRGVPVSRAAALLRRGPYAAEQAREAGLVDSVMFYDELVTELKERHGDRLAIRTRYGRRRGPQAGGAGTMNLFNLLMGGMPSPSRRPSGPAVAVIYAVGPIMKSDAGTFGLGEQVVSARTFVREIRKAAADDDVVAIVLRVDSPGGSADACDMIWRELRLADRKKPVVASLSDVAASGGYYIAAGARTIYAEPGCLTGSIGVLGGKLVLAGLFEKLGLNVFVLERGGRTGMMSMASELTPDERRKFQELVDGIYRTFLERVAETRSDMSLQEVDEVAQGRVWTARQAEQNGLVDSIGGLREAIAAAKEAAGIPADKRVQVIELPRPRSLLEFLLFGKEDAAQMLVPGAALPFLPPLHDVRAHLRALMCLHDEPSVCILPAVIR